jgi:hypothetical protein
MISIRKKKTADGTWYEIEDFPAYAEALRRYNLEAPPVKYQVFLSSEAEGALQASNEDLEGQIALFFRLGPASGIDYRILGS